MKPIETPRVDYMWPTIDPTRPASVEEGDETSATHCQTYSLELEKHPLEDPDQPVQPGQDD